MLGGGSHSVIAEYLEKRLVAPTRHNNQTRTVRSKSTIRNDNESTGNKNSYFSTKRGSENCVLETGRYFESRRDTQDLPAEAASNNQLNQKDNSERLSAEESRGAGGTDDKYHKPIYGGVTPEVPSLKDNLNLKVRIASNSVIHSLLCNLWGINQVQCLDGQAKWSKCGSRIPG